MKSTLVLIMTAAILTVFLGTQPAVGQQQDALDQALSEVGMTRDDLGWQPPGWWSFYPGDIPYKLRQFDDLFAEPMANISYLRTLANAVRTCLDPAKRDERTGRLEYGGRLFQLTTALGVHTKFGAFRGYAANLLAPATPLAEAILTVHRAAGRPNSAARSS